MGILAPVKPYAIAALLSDEQKQRALSKGYTADFGMLRTYSTFVCPLGVAFGLTRSPFPHQATKKLMEGRDESDLIAVNRAVLDFIDAADTGKIKPEDLAAALGVTPSS